MRISRSVPVAALAVVLVAAVFSGISGPAALATPSPSATPGPGTPGPTQLPTMSAPTNVTALAGDASAWVTWDWSGTQSFPLYGWKVVAQDTTDGSSVELSESYLDASITDSAFAAEGLVNGDSYTFTVRGVMSNGGNLVEGDLSDPSAAVTPVSGAVRPSAQAVTTYDPTSTAELATAPDATPTAPVAAGITVPAGADASAGSGVSLTVLTGSTVAQPGGYSFFGQQVNIVAPVATAANPLVITFTLDASIIPAGTDPDSIQLLRTEAGQQIALRTCAGPTGPLSGAADACVTRSLDATSGDITLTAVTAHASSWNAARLHYSLSGPSQPVDPSPTVNTAKAGSAIPVKFTLGPGHGLDVLVAGYPKTGVATCGTASTDEIEQTLPDVKSGLTYDAATGQYTYKWKTTTAQKGCRDLVLRFRDGSVLRALFNLR